MGLTKIQWSDFTQNFWIGCSRVKKERMCSFCYAEKFSERWNFAKWGEEGNRHKTSESNWKKPYAWNRKAIKEGVRYKVFCSSLSDIFDDHKSIPQEWRDNLFKTIRETQNLDWLLLTKRPENYTKFLPADWIEGYRNVWMGVSIGDKRGRDARMDHFLNTPAYVRFISGEPLLERFELPDYGITQFICGGESGPISKIGELDLNVVRYMIDQAKEKGIKVFFKQTGSILSKKLKLKDGHGGDFDEYPPALDWLKIREVPDPHPSFQLFPPNPEDINEDLKLEL